MYNVIIVDDEPVIRYGLKASIDWQNEGLTLLGDFPNGAEALKVMEENHVDILITDIKMPIMDGLVLMKKALERFPKLKVILVSSYNDFDYVKEGLKYGAMDYVLKPTLEPDDFLQLIKKCIKKIKEEQNIEEKLNLVDQTAYLQERKRLEFELKQVLLYGKDRIYSDEMIPWMDGPYLIIYMKMNNLDHLEQKFGYLYQNFILEDIQDRFYSNQGEGFCFLTGKAEMLILLKDMLNPVKTIYELKHKVIDETNISFSFGYDMISNLSEIDKGFQRSNSACQRRFFHPNEFIFAYHEPKEKKGKRLKVKQLKQFLLPFDENKVTAFIRKRYEKWKLEEIEPSEIQLEASDILMTLFIKRLDYSLLLDKCTDLKKTESLDELFDLLIKQIEECVLHISEQNHKSYPDNDLMESALSYIHDHYTEELTLQMAADHIHISRNYFSILFKRFSDKTFIDYVIELRIKKASELLEFTTLKVYEVAERSGFKDVKYFSKLFKRMTGLSPIDYRTEKQK